LAIPFWALAKRHILEMINPDRVGTVVRGSTGNRVAKEDHGVDRCKRPHVLGSEAVGQARKTNEDYPKLGCTHQRCR